MMTLPRMHHEMQVQRMDLAARLRRTETLLYTDPHFLSSQEATGMEGDLDGKGFLMRLLGNAPGAMAAIGSEGTMWGWHEAREMPLRLPRTTDALGGMRTRVVSAARAGGPLVTK